jgi:signal transduction histidine kinase
VGGSDEVAQLGRAFDSMRLRLADLDRVRREFIANASHELRTPLFSLGGFLELLDDEDMDPETRREFLAETRAQVDRLARLASDLLDLSRLDAGDLRFERGDVELASLARTVAEEFRLVADATDHPLRFTAAGEVHALGDRERIVRIGRILVENSLRHTPPGTPIEVTAAARDGRAALSVRDAGPGIPVEEQEHVFERFYRARGGKASGSGLGLAIASELATRMGGRLRLSSGSGETVFTLELPSAEPFSRENGPPSEAEVGGSRDTSLV